MFLVPLFLSLLLFSDECVARIHEPSCTYMDNMEKILEKLVRNEHKLGLFGEKLDEMESKLNGKILDLDKSEIVRKGQIDDVVKTMKEMQEINTEKSLEMTQEFKETKKGLEDTKAGLEQTLANDLKKHDVALKLLQDTYKTPTVVFTAKQVSDATVTDGKVIICPTIVSNEGGAYDGNTGYFTAPYDGLYMFTATLCSNHRKQVFVHLVAAGTVLASTYKYNHDTNGSCTSITGIAWLSSGDTAWVEGSRTNSGALFSGSNERWPSFSGMLVHI